MYALRLFVFAHGLAACIGTNLLYDFQVSEVVDGKELNKEENEIFIDESFITSDPPFIELDIEQEDGQKLQNIDDLAGRDSLNLSDIQYETYFGKEDRFTQEEHKVFAAAFGAFHSTKEWGEWTCCRRVINIQSRERVKVAPKLEMQYQRCSDNYCQASACKDNINVCQQFLNRMGSQICNPTHFLVKFMSHHCPRICKFCEAPLQRNIMVTPSEVPWWKTIATTTQLKPIFTTTKRTTTVPWWATRTTRTTTQTTTVTTTTMVPTTLAPKPIVSHPKLVKITILRHNIHSRYPSYKFIINEPNQLPIPWNKISEWSNELSSFHLYREPTALFLTAIRFCLARDQYGIEKWSVTKKACPVGWTQRFVFYGSQHRSKSSQLYFVGSRPDPLATSRVSTNFPKDGFTSSIFFFYGPKPDEVRPTPRPTFITSRRPPTQRPRTTPAPRTSWTTPTTTPFKYFVRRPSIPTQIPHPTQRPTPASYMPTNVHTPPPTYNPNPPLQGQRNLQGPVNNMVRTPKQQRGRPTQKTPPPPYIGRNLPPPRRPSLPRPQSSSHRPPYPVSAPHQPFSRSVFNENCLRAHNFFRAVHNVPALKWSPELAKNAQAWADELKKIAPERPNNFKLPHLRTENWPHSDSGRGHRKNGDGENIAWDLSGDGSPIEESILRWYAEVFYYNRDHPTYQPSRDKPIGHLTQLLWKDTTHVGCGIATTKLPVSGFNRISTWTVAHYSPGGNTRYRNSAKMTKETYNEQVPDYEQTACMTRSRFCTMGNQCMAFGPDRTSCSCRLRVPTCKSAGGCIAWCENKRGKFPWKEECSGRSECTCGIQGASCK